jgi:signal transduction histidine kinase/FixJ family two-component response regulator
VDAQIAQLPRNKIAQSEIGKPRRPPAVGPADASIGRTWVLEAALILGIVISLVLFVIAMSNFRIRVQHAAELSQKNVVDVLVTAIEHNIELFERSLHNTAKSVWLPGVWDLPRATRDAVIFSESTQIPNISSLMVIDRDGNLIADTTNPTIPSINFADRDYFRYHQDNPELTVHLIGSMKSRLRDEPILAFSLRLNDERGNFAGIVAGGILFAHFKNLLAGLDPDADGAIGIFQSDGTVLAHAPFKAGVVDRDLSGGSLFHVPDRGSNGTRIDISTANGVERLVTYRSLRDLPIFVAFSQSTDAVFADWKQTTFLLGGVILGLCGFELYVIWRLRRARVFGFQARQAATVSAAALAVVNQTLEERISAALLERDQVHDKLASAQRMEAVGQLAGGIAHDFNNVLQTISGACGLMQTRLHDPARIEQLSSLALGAAERGGSVTRRLLVFARRATLQTEEVNALALLRDLQELLNHTLLGTIELELDVPPSLPMMRVDQLQLETVIINLITNARDATPAAGGKIIIEATSETITETSANAAGLDAGTYVRLKVVDHGIGMDANTLARAVEPFFTTKGIGEGTGLGLSMTKGFVEQSGGKLEISSEIGEGTTVSLWFPTFGEKALRSDQLAAPDQRQPLPSGGTVLVVDDNHDARELMSEWLCTRKFDVHQAVSGQAALAALDNGLKIDVLVTDLSMPGMDGIELAHRVRERVSELPVIILTGNTGAIATGAIERTIGKDSCTVLLKPIRVTELSDQITLALRRSTAGSASLASVVVDQRRNMELAMS